MASSSWRGGKAVGERKEQSLAAAPESRKATSAPPSGSGPRLTLARSAAQPVPLPRRAATAWATTAHARQLYNFQQIKITCVKMFEIPLIAKGFPNEYKVI